MHRRLFVVLRSGLSPLLSGTLSAVPTRAQNPVHWTANAATHAAGTITAHVSAAIETGWHVYALTQGEGGPVAMRIALATGQPFTLGAIAGPPPKSDYDANFDMTVDEYEQHAAFTIPLRSTADTHAPNDSVALRIRYQACNAQICLPPRTDVVNVPVK